MAKVLITGITGFLGSYLSKLLAEQGYDVVGISTKDGTDNVYQCDLCDKIKTTKVVQEASPDIIIHCAALSSVTRGDTLDYYVHNVLATENLIESANTVPNLTRFLFISTAGVYGNQDYEILSETLNPNPVSHYGYSKFICERLCLNNLKSPSVCTIIRPFNIIGCGQNEEFIVPKLVSHFKEKKSEVHLGNINTVRDYIDIYSTCNIISRLIKSKESYGQIVNLCSGVGYSVADLIAILESLSGHKISVITDKRFIRKNEVWKLLGDIKRLNSFLQSSHLNNMKIDTILAEMLQN